MKKVPVCIIGCGPIGLAGALLLAKLEIPTLIVEKRSELNTHPRSRFVDTNTMELMRLLGIEKAVEQTGLGPYWTEHIRWVESLSGQEYAGIRAPTFYSMPRSTSPCIPVMTCQDYVENALLDEVRKQPNIDCHFNTAANEVEQTASSVTLTITNTQTNETEQIEAGFLIGADGPHSRTRQIIGTELHAPPTAMFSQDVLFDADLSKFVGNRKGGLLHCITSGGISTFQPLNGKERWRIQIFKPQPEDLTQDEILERIYLAIGSRDVELEFKSIGHWQGTPGCVDKFAEGRIFLAGDAAHVSVPTGGMGNNIGFFGIRNLTWKLAEVIKGRAPQEILKTYETEMRPVAQKRIDHGMHTTQGVGKMIRAIYSGEDHKPGIYATQMYADYDGIILGDEMQSSLIQIDEASAYPVENPVTEFVPQIISGRRAPHIWLDDLETQSTLDWFGTNYVLIVGCDTNFANWQALGIEGLICVQMPELENRDVYPPDEIVLVRPDGIIADHWAEANQDVASAAKRIEALKNGN